MRNPMRPGYRAATALDDEGGAGVRPWRRITSAIRFGSGRPPPAALITSVVSRKYCGPRRRRDYAERFCVLDLIVVEPMNGSSRYAEGLARPYFDLFSVHGPRQHSVDAVDRLFVMIVTMRRRCHTLRTRDSHLKGRDAAGRVSPVIRKRTASGPRRMVSSEGLTPRFTIFCFAILDTMHIQRCL
jgi:hypothetical protein